MALAAQTLPQLGSSLFLTDGGLETTLIFLDHIDLPCFAAFDLLRTREGTARLRSYYDRHIEIAQAQKLGFILESPTWRASPDWAEKLGYSPEALAEINRDAIRLMAALRAAHPGLQTVISGCVGPRGDGYAPDRHMPPAEAEAYHAPQIRIYAEEGADMIAAITMTYPDEAIGVARAAAKAGLPSAISFTTETDGRLPNGQSLKEAILAVDAATDNAPAYYMINCAHPVHFDHALKTGEAWLKRVRGIRANASMRSHAELDNASDLDDGDPEDLGRRYAALRAVLPDITVVGGCCGTDHRHIAAIGQACAGHARAA